MTKSATTEEAAQLRKELGELRAEKANKADVLSILRKEPHDPVETLLPKSVTNDLIADDTVTADEIAANAVGSDEIAANAVGSDEIAANAVGASEIGSLPAARAANTVAFTHNSSGNFLAVTFNGEHFDTDTIHDTGANTSRLTATTGGVYVISGHVEWAAAAGSFRLGIRVNGATFIAQNPFIASTVLAAGESISAVYKLAATEYVELMAWQNSGGNRTINRVANYSPEFAMAWLGDG